MSDNDYNPSLMEIKGKPYLGAHDAIAWFRNDFPLPRGRIVAQIIDMEQSVLRCEIFVDDTLVSSADVKGDGQKTLEKLQTNSVRRALAFAGYGTVSALAQEGGVSDGLDEEQQARVALNVAAMDTGQVRQSLGSGNGRADNENEASLWPSKNTVNVVMDWFRQRQLSDTEILALADVKSIEDGDGWRKYMGAKSAINHIQKAFNAQLKTDDAEESAVFNFMSYVGKSSNLLFATTPPGSENNIVATVFEGRGGIRKWGSDELCEQLQLSQYDKIKGKNIISDWVEMVIPVEFFYVFVQDGGDEYCKITGIKGSPEIAF